ncbi:MAG: hypothetical protein ACJ71R_18405 [Nitrososphaeraceae archaeon]
MKERITHPCNLDEDGSSEATTTPTWIDIHRERYSPHKYRKMVELNSDTFQGIHG